MVPNKYCTVYINYRCTAGYICILCMVFYVGEIKTDMVTQQYFYTRGLQRDVIYIGWPETNSTLVYEPKCGGRGRVAGSQPMSTAVHRSPNKLWRSNSIFNLRFTPTPKLVLKFYEREQKISNFFQESVENVLRHIRTSNVLKWNCAFNVSWHSVNDKTVNNAPFMSDKLISETTWMTTTWMTTIWMTTFALDAIQACCWGDSVCTHLIATNDEHLKVNKLRILF